MRSRFILLFFFKQTPAYEIRISNWSSDVCSSDLRRRVVRRLRPGDALDGALAELLRMPGELPFQGIGEEGRNLRSAGRSEERRVGKECVSTGSSRWSPDH